MELYLLQHGLALPAEEDPEQPLAKEGVAQIQAAGRVLQRLGVRPGLIACSPKKRARQSAALIAEAINFPTATSSKASVPPPHPAPGDLAPAASQRRERRPAARRPPPLAGRGRLAGSRRRLPGAHPFRKRRPLPPRSSRGPGVAGGAALQPHRRPAQADRRLTARDTAAAPSAKKTVRKEVPGGVSVV